MAGNSQVSLIVGFPKAPNPHTLGALHRKFQIRQDEKLDLINGYSIDLPAEKVDSYLESLPQEASVMFDKPIFEEPKAGRARSGDFSDAESSAQPPQFRRPEGLKELHARGIDGHGTTIAVVDSGIARHKDLKDRIKFFKDFNNSGNKSAVDPFGHGTHVTGIAAGDSDNDEADGIAPKADLVGLRITSPLEAIQAITWAVENKDKYGIDVLNLSLGVDANLPNKQDPFAQAAQKAVDAGLITVVASGNECFTTHCAGSISTPGILPDAITVGAFDDKGTIALDDDRMWGRSSHGPTAHDQLPKPDLVAHGVNIFAPSSAGSSLGKSRPRWEDYHSDQGSSMATPMVSGTAALLLQLEPTLTQQGIKELLMSTALPMTGVGSDAQGAGRLNLVEAVRRLEGKQTDKTPARVQADLDFKAS